MNLELYYVLWYSVQGPPPHGMVSPPHAGGWCGCGGGSSTTNNSSTTAVRSTGYRYRGIPFRGGASTRDAGTCTYYHTYSGYSAKTYSSWWFQPIRKILVNLDHFPNFRGEHKKSLKPPPSIAKTTGKRGTITWRLWWCRYASDSMTVTKLYPQTLGWSRTILEPKGHLNSPSRKGHVLTQKCRVNMTNPTR